MQPKTLTLLPRATLCAILCASVFASVFANRASAQSQQAQFAERLAERLGGLRNKAIDRSVQLIDPAYVDKKDRRGHLTMFGHRPTVVVLATYTQWKASKSKEYIAALKKLDKQARKWRRLGVDALLIMPHTRIFKNRKPIDLKLLAKAKLKNLTVSANRNSDTHPDERETLQQDLLTNFASGSDLALHWVFIDSLGHVSETGANVFSKDLKSLLKKVEVPVVARHSVTKRIFASIVNWRLGDAMKSIAKARSKCTDPEKSAPLLEKLTTLDAMVAKSEEHYRKVVVAPHAEFGYIPDQADALEHLAKVLFAGSKRSAEILTEVTKLRNSESHGNLVAERKALRKVCDLHKTNEALVESDYNKAMGNRSGYDAATYNRCITTHHKASLAAVTTFLKEHKGSPYRKEATVLYRDLREEIADASGN